MKYRRIAVTIVAICLFAVPFAANAQDASATRRQLMGERCQSIKLLLDELQRRDLVARTNLGREYESMTRLFNAFNQRVRSNNLNAQAFEQLTSQFKDATAQFRAAYVDYDDSMIKLKEIDCKNKQADFDAQLTATRSLRDATEGASTHAAAIAGHYRTQMTQLQTELPAQTTGSND